MTRGTDGSAHSKQPWGAGVRNSEDPAHHRNAWPIATGCGQDRQVE